MEMKSITLNEQKYDSFVDKTARAKKDISVLKYGESTLEEIEAAVSFGFPIFCLYDTLYYFPLSKWDPDSFVATFVGRKNDEKVTCTFNVNKWEAETTEFEYGRDYVATEETNFAELQAAYESGLTCYVNHDLGVSLGTVLCLVNYVSPSNYLGRVVRCSGVGNDGKCYTGYYEDGTWTFEEKKEVFIAEYGVTTREEVLNAYRSGMCVMAEKYGVRLPLIASKVYGFIFSGYDNDGEKHITYRVRDEGWEEETTPDSQAFYAEYGVTTRAEIIEKINAGFACYCRRNSRIFSLCSDNEQPGGFYFAGADGDTSYRWYVSDSNEWYDQEFDVPPIMVVNHTFAPGGGTADKTYAEIREAYDAGKLVLVMSGFKIYKAMSVQPSGLSFSEITTGGGKRYGYSVSTADVWTRTDEPIPYSTTAITENSNDSYLPTAKAVYDFVTEQLGAIETGSGGGLVVTVTATTSGDPGNQTTTYTLDATYEDIKAAVDANQLVVLRRNVSRYGYQYYLFNSYQSNGVDFRSVLDFNGTYEVISAYSNGSVTYSTYDNPIPSSVATKEYVDTMLGVIENGSY